MSVEPGTGLVISAKCVPAGEIVNVAAFDVPPPGAGLETVTLAVPGLAISAAAMAAVNCVPLTKVVVRFEPFHCTVEVATKLLPLTVSTKAAPNAVALFGLRVETAGTGLLIVVIVKVCALDVPPPGDGLTTVRLIVPADAISAAVMAAVT